GGHVGGGGVEQPRDGVPQRGPAGVADVQRAGRVRRDELDVDGVPGEAVVPAVVGAGLDDGPGQLTGGGGLEGDVEEARAGDVDRGDARARLEPAGEDVGEVARLPAGRPRQLHRDVARPVAVPLPLRSLYADLGGHLETQVAGLDGGGQGVTDRVGELIGGHDRPV